MALDPLVFFESYFLQESNRLPKTTRVTDAAPGDFTIDALVSNRRKILEVKLAVLLAASKKRFAIREANLESLLDDELTVRNQQLATPRYVVSDGRNYPINQSGPEQRILDIERQRREEESGCWRDIIPVMRDVLTTWEALEQARARAMFLASYPNTKLEPDQSHNHE